MDPRSMFPFNPWIASARGGKIISMTTMNQDDRHEVINHDRVLVFDGTLLGSSSSKSSSKSRWNEIRIFKTTGGSYIVAGIGRTEVPGEVDRCWAHIAEDAEGVVELLYIVDADSIRYMTNTARAAIEQAAAVDDKIRKAFAVQYVA